MLLENQLMTMLHFTTDTLLFLIEGNKLVGEIEGLRLGDLFDLIYELDTQVTKGEALGIADCSCNLHTPDPASGTQAVRRAERQCVLHIADAGLRVSRETRIRTTCLPRSTIQRSVEQNTLVFCIHQMRFDIAQALALMKSGYAKCGTNRMPMRSAFAHKRSEHRQLMR